MNEMKAKPQPGEMKAKQMVVNHPSQRSTREIQCCLQR